MKRGKPLRRKTPLRSRGKGKYARRARDLEHMRKVRKLPCMVRLMMRTPWDQLVAEGLTSSLTMSMTPCGGRVEADHMGERAYGQKAPDDTCAPLCCNHHGERTDGRGAFANVPKDKMRVFCNWAIARTWRELEEMSRG